jgi:hypothetical protein
MRETIYCNTFLHVDVEMGDFSKYLRFFRIATMAAVPLRPVNQMAAGQLDSEAKHGANSDCQWTAVRSRANPCLSWPHDPVPVCLAPHGTLTMKSLKQSELRKS